MSRFYSWIGLVVALFLGLAMTASVLAKPGATAATGKPSESSKPAPPTVVNRVDFGQYVGTWYEIARMPMFFQRQCIGNVTAEYTMLDNGLVQVMNSCATKSGTTRAEGRGMVVDSVTQAKLKVTFLNIFGWRFLAAGDYWVIGLDKNYEWAIIGHPERKYGWLLSRTPGVSKERLAGLTNELKRQGYDPCKFEMTPQEGGQSTTARLCDAINGQERSEP